MCPQYQAPSPWRLSNTLLDEAYTRLKEKVDSILASSERINVIFDESTDINHNRILNLFLMTARGPLFEEHTKLGHATIDADWHRDHIHKRLTEILHGQLHKITSFSTDTCSVMESTWKKLSLMKDFRNALFVPCDSHGLQLLVKDIISLS